MPAKPVRTEKVWARKSWYAVRAPSWLGDKIVAQTPAVKEQEVIGRILNVQLSEITGNLKHYQTEIKLRITTVSGNEVKTEYAGQELARDIVARIVRRWSSRIDGVQEIKTPDGKKLRIKFIIISGRRINTKRQSALRKKSMDFLKDAMAKKTLEEIVQDIISTKTQRELGAQLHTIYPTRSVEIRKIEVV